MTRIPEHDLIARGTQRGRLLSRGLRRRCPRCGAGDLFPSLFTIHDPCPRCGLIFEREEGYWLGAMIVAFAVIEGLFGLAFVATMLVTWPDVPWTALLIVGLLVTATLPVAISPWMRTIWMAVDRAFMPAPDQPEPPPPGRQAPSASG
ncbi:hypothetical protein BH23ACT10_BH23ACT10_26990 [soil metagenome]